MRTDCASLFVLGVTGFGYRDLLVLKTPAVHVRNVDKDRSRMQSVTGVDTEPAKLGPFSRCYIWQCGEIYWNG